MAATLGLGTAGATHADTISDLLTQAVGASASADYFPTAFDYSADPTNLFAPVYTIEPIGAPDVEVTTDATGAVYGTQEFGAYSLGIPVDTFTGSFEYSPVSSPLDIFGNPYIDTIVTSGSPDTLFPENTAFLVTEFGSGYGNVLEESMNAAGTSATVGDYVLTPFGDENITPIVDLFLPQGVGINDPLGAATEVASSASAAPAADGSLATDIGLLNSAETNVTDAFNIWTQAYGEAPASTDALTATINQFESVQTPLLSSDNPLLSGLGEAVFTSPDQQLAQFSESFLSAAEAYAADPSTTNGLDAAEASLQFDGSLLGDSLPANIFGIVIDKLFDLTPAADLAANADPVAALDPSIFADLLSSIGL